MEDTFEVLLYDPNKPRQGIYAKTETKPAAITNTFPTSPASAAAPSASPAPATPKEAPDPAATRQTAAQPWVSRSSSTTPYPHPTLRSRRAESGS